MVRQDREVSHVPVRTVHSSAANGSRRTVAAFRAGRFGTRVPAALKTRLRFGVNDER